VEKIEAGCVLMNLFKIEIFSKMSND